MHAGSANSRPQVHFTAITGWINDPLGLSWHEGQYHAFFQYVPDRTTWAPECQWGHATSPDLLHWSEQPVALTPGDGDDGVWSGSIATAADGRPHLFYTAIEASRMALGTIRTATPDDSQWSTWKKGPTVLDPADDHDLAVVRDPFVFRDGGLWRMLLGASLANGCAGVLSYSSHDLVTWKSDGVPAQRPGSASTPIWTGALWECPQLLRFPDADVLVVSVWDRDTLHDVVYCVGAYDGGTFHAGEWQQLTVGERLYAASSFRDRDGQQAVVFWIRGIAEQDAWAGALSIPYRVTLESGTLRLAPHPELERAWSARSTLQAGSHRVGPQTYVEWVGSPAARLDLLGRSGDVVARLRLRGGDLVVDLDGLEHHLVTTGDDPVRLLLDGPVVEVSTGRQVLATPCAPVDAIVLSDSTAVVHSQRASF